MHRIVLIFATRYYRSFVHLSASNISQNYQGILYSAEFALLGVQAVNPLITKLSVHSPRENVSESNWQNAASVTYFAGTGNMTLGGKFGVVTWPSY